MSNSFKPIVKGRWIDAQDLYEFLINILKDCEKKDKEIVILNDPKKMKLQGMMVVLKSILQFLIDKTLVGDLKVRGKIKRTESKPEPEGEKDDKVQTG